MELVWQKDAQGYWTADYRGSTLSLIRLAGVWRWEALVKGCRIRHGTEVSYHLAKATAMDAAV
ncbi:MAG: hypothetical protein WCJ64_10025, partial [Rhodospirillaceae bacterium]